MSQTQENATELLALERSHPLMVNRLRFFRILASNPMSDVSMLVNQLGVPKFEMQRWIELYKLGGIDLLLDPRTLLDDPPTGKTISDYGEEELLRLYNNHPRQLGSAVIADLRSCKKTGKPSGKTYLPDCSLFQPYKDFETQIKDWRITDCFTYIKDVLRYVYEKLGQPKTFTALNAADRGTVLAQKLTALGWKSYFCMRDTENPYDTDIEDARQHVKKYKEVVKTKKWWNVPVSGVIVNYLPNSNTRLNPKITELDKDGKRKYDALANVRFGICTFTEGRHTGLFSRGEIYEVHWASLSGQSKIENPNYTFFYQETLYEKTVMKDFGWEEILLTIPPDSKVNLL